MAARGKKASTDGAPSSEPATPSPAPPNLDLKSLAEAILARRHRPRVADVRRLAEAVLKKKKKGKKGEGKTRKLSKIPGQKRGK